MFINEVNIKRKKKHLSMHTLTCWGVDLSTLNFALNHFLQALPFNKYTQRGFRLARGKFKKKLGKVSKYSALKSKIF